MRILFISSYYPPHEIGGWPQLTRDLNDALAKRGHETLVLTSCHGIARPSIESGVARVLYAEADIAHYQPLSILSYKRRLMWNMERTKAVIGDFVPDAVAVHMMWNLNRAVPWIAEQLLPDRVMHYLASVVPYQDDPHVVYWRDPAIHPVKRIGKSILAPYALNPVEADLKHHELAFKHVACVSDAARQGLATALRRDPDDFAVIYNGVELDLFHPADHQELRANSSGTKLLFAGNLVQHKGVHTVIEALSRISQAGHGEIPNLSIAGAGRDDYEHRLRDLVRRHKLEDYVTFLGKVPRDQMPEVMRSHDIFVLPSIWEEPLARVLHEAMASGLAIIGTNTGGTGEALVHERTGLVFAAEDDQELAQHIISLNNDPAWRARLAQNAFDMVRDRFSFDRMVDRTESFLLEVASD